MMTVNPLLELVEQYVALHDRARAAAQRIRNAHELMKAADFVDPEPLGILAIPQPGTTEPGYADTPERIDAVFAAAIAEGGAEAPTWIARRDAALARLATIRVARDIFGVPEAEQTEAAIWKKIDRLGAEIRATPARSVADVAAKLRALVANANASGADTDTFDRRAVLDVLADAERLAGSAER